MSRSLTCRQMPASIQNRRLGVESLEDRKMMATTTLVLDFTPDYRQGTFLDTFYNTKNANGTAPAFLDFNGDRKITNQDAEIAAGQIAAVVQNTFRNAMSGFSASVVYGDATTQTNFGYRYLDYGRSSVANQVAVMYVGGKNVGELGRAPMASDGYNIEGYGQTYSQAVANMLMGRANVTPGQFAWAVGQAAAHELGHMMGLRHSTNYTGDIMNPAQSLTPWNDTFSTQNRYTEGGGPQNATQELRNSFAGQNVTYSNYNGGAKLMGTDGFVDDGSDAGDDCDFNLDSLLDEFDNLDSQSFENGLSPTEAVPTSSFVGPLAFSPNTASNPILSSPHKSNVTGGISPRSDLLNLLATELHSTKKETTSNSPAKAAAGPAELDEVFTDFGMVTAN